MPDDRYTLAAGESLAGFAQQHGVAGWQALYFAAANDEIRQQYPDPWADLTGAALKLPAAADQYQALSQRMTTLASMQRRGRAIAQAQRRYLAQPVAHDKEARPELTRQTVATSLDVIAMLRSKMTGLSHSNWQLASDALQRFALGNQADCAQLFTLLARASEGVIWSLPAPLANAWCNAASPWFWAKELVLPSVTPSVSPAPQPSMSGRLRRHNERACTAVMQELDHLHAEAVTELARLRRRLENAQGYADDQAG